LKVAIHQPGFLPWLGFFEKVASVDCFVLLDTVQFEKNSFDNRNRVRDKTSAHWLTVPVLSSGRFGNNDWQALEINNNVNWAHKHIASLKQWYGRSIYWSDIEALLCKVYGEKYEYLLDLNLDLIFGFCKLLGIKTKIIQASTLGVTQKKSKLVLEIVNAVGGTQYLSGVLGRDYLELDGFKSYGIDVSFQDYKYPVYAQLYPNFISGLSILDLYANHGADSFDILMRKY